MTMKNKSIKMLSRRQALGIILSGGLQFLSVTQVTATSYNRLYLQVDNILFFMRVYGEPEIRIHVEEKSILQNITLYVLERLENHRPNTNVTFRNRNSEWPTDAFDKKTMRVFIEISLVDRTSEAPPFDGYLGSIGLRMQKGNEILDRRALASQLFLSTREQKILNDHILDTLRQEVDRVIIEPFLRMASDL